MPRSNRGAHLCSAYAKWRTLVGMGGAVWEAVAAGVMVLFLIAVVVALVFEWRDDHEWMHGRSF